MTGSVDASSETTDLPAGSTEPLMAEGLLVRGTAVDDPAFVGVAERDVFLAVDIGGTKMEVGLVDASGLVLDRVRTATPETSDPEVLFDGLCRIIEEVLSRSTVLPSICGVGCGGPMESGGRTVSPLNIPGWRGFPLQGRLDGHLGLPVVVDNDAKALALGEGWIGAARGQSNYLAMVVSTGVGGGVVLDGRLLDGSGGNAGHIGHSVVEPQGRMCVCGGQGCLEAEASGTAIAAITGHPASEADIAMRRRCGTLVGRAVASVANLLDLQLAVVAGSVALGYGEEFFAAAQAEIDLRCGLDFARSTRIERAGLGADGPLVGAAAVARRYLMVMEDGGR